MAWRLLHLLTDEDRWLNTVTMQFGLWLVILQAQFWTILHSPLDSCGCASS